MNWCVLQQDVRPVGAEQLKLGFARLRRFSDTDAIRCAREAYGILVRNLTQEEAMVLKNALQGAQISTHACPESSLPKLCDPKFVRRMEFSDQAMVIYDPLGRALPIPWDQVSLISAGAIRHFQMNQIVTYEAAADSDGFAGEFETVRDVRTKMDPTLRLVLDIFIAGGGMRFQVEGENFMYGYIIKEPVLEPSEKFQRLATQLCQRATKAFLNRGAIQVQNGACPVVYATRGYFADESTWLLWKSQRKTG
jgi:hypothetical protein